MIVDKINSIIDYIYVFRVPLLLLFSFIFIFLKKRTLSLLCFFIIILIVIFDFVSPIFTTVKISPQSVNNFVNVCQNISSEDVESKIEALTNEYSVKKYTSYTEAIDSVMQLDIEPTKTSVHDFPNENIPCAVVVSSVFHHRNLLFPLFDTEHYSATLYIIIDKYVIDISLFELRKTQFNIEEQIDLFSKKLG